MTMTMTMTQTGIVVSMLLCAAACGKDGGGGGGASIKTAPRELSFGNLGWKVTGEMPDWPQEGMQIVKREDHEVKGMAVASLDLGVYGGTGIDQAGLMAEIERNKGVALVPAKSELVEPLAEREPGLWSFTVKRSDMGDSYETQVYRMKPDFENPQVKVKYPVFLRCIAWSRKAHAKSWKQLGEICAKLDLAT